MNSELFIARRVSSSKSGNISGPIIKVALLAVTLGLAIMIITLAVVSGFKKEVTEKVTGFASHLVISNMDSNSSFEVSQPINKNQSFYPSLQDLPNFEHIQVYATKSGIIQTDGEMQGVVLKGISSDFDWSFFDKSIIEGTKVTLNDSVKSNDVLISSYIAKLMKLEVGESFLMFFVQDPPLRRRFTVCGIYDTGFEELDKVFIIGDIRNIQKLNKWSDDEVAGFEVFIDDFDKLNECHWQLFDIAGSKFMEDGSKLQIKNVRQTYRQIFDWIGVFDVNVLIMLVLVFIVAGFNMVSGLLILILERTNMIGVLKALGATNGYIRKIFLYQASVFIIRGMFWGNIIGLSICLIQKYTGAFPLDQSVYYMSQVPINLSISTLLILNVSTLIVIVAVLIIPSYIITMISPEKTIRYN